MIFIDTDPKHCLIFQNSNWRSPLKITCTHKKSKNTTYLKGVCNISVTAQNALPNTTVICNSITSFKNKLKACDVCPSVTCIELAPLSLLSYYNYHFQLPFSCGLSINRLKTLVYLARMADKLAHSIRILWHEWPIIRPCCKLWVLINKTA